MRRLWSGYDTGGISMARSLRAALLESVMYLIPAPEGKNFGNEELLEEAAKRKRSLSREYQPEFPACMSETHFLSLDIFTCFVILEMKRWYDHDRRVNKFWLTDETRMVKALCRLVKVPDKLKPFRTLNISFSPQKLLQEGRDRLNRKLSEETRYPLW
jgi:hypothetical protein